MTRRALVGCEMSGEVRDALAATGYWDEVWSADILTTEKPVEATIFPDGSLVHEATSPLRSGTFHYCGDVLDLFERNHPVNASRFIDVQCQYEADLWDLFIGHPPCDHLSQAGAVYWKHKDSTRGGDGRMQQGAAFFMKMVNAPARYKAVENPVGVMGLPKQACCYRRPDQVTQPWMHGDPLIKRTCLWLEKLPPLEATHRLEDYPELQRIATGGGSHRTDWKRTGKSNNGHEDRRGRAFRKIERSRTPPGFAHAMAEQWTRFIREQEQGS
jgi:hypothetical protein